VNKLEAIILDQHDRVKAARENPVSVLEEAKGEILAIATLELVEEILSDRTLSPHREGMSINATLREIDDPRALGNRAIKSIQTGHGLVRLGFLQDNQGYSGGIVISGDDRHVFGNSMSFGCISDNDPIQEAIGDTFYPPMMWAKALRAEAYKNRPESAREMPVAIYLSKLGLSLGAFTNACGDVIGATGFMPGERLSGDWGGQEIQDHITSEPIEAFRLSGLCDQAALDPDLLLSTPEFSQEVLESDGSLN
jgi:hypothetical protein